MQTLLDKQAIATSLNAITDHIVAAAGREPIALIGVRTRGEVLARRIEQLITEAGSVSVERGTLDITLYRDDLDRKGPAGPMVRATEIDFEINERQVVLVDDVIWTGRTARAALDALMDLGRPQVIRLAVLIDRGGRELPIQPDFVGQVVEPPSEAKVKVFVQEIDDEDAVKLV